VSVLVVACQGRTGGSLELLVSCQGRVEAGFLEVTCQGRTSVGGAELEVSCQGRTESVTELYARIFLGAA
jgi:hypothetical protein